MQAAEIVFSWQVPAPECTLQLQLTIDPKAP